MSRTIKIGFSPCPNDTFIFDALIHGRIDTGDLKFEAVMADVEELNRMALNGDLEITKLSFHAFAHVLDTYQMLPSGSALGRGVGPLLISKKKLNLEQAADVKIAIPGKFTTAVFLLKMFLPQNNDLHEMLFSDIEDAVLSGAVDAGLIIHENRFTYESKGLFKIADMGELWENSTGLPIPLGGIAIRRDMDMELRTQISAMLRKSIEHAYANPDQALPYIRKHAQEMDLDVLKKHIDLYVNDFSLDLGREGRTAVSKLLSVASGKEISDFIITDAVLS